MAEPADCPHCGSTLADDGADGLCPACLAQREPAGDATRSTVGPDPSQVPTRTAAPPTRHEAESGQTIGPYRVLQKVGEGGMGEVWLAEQSHPVKRRVALKVIKQGMNTKQVVARFESERQALALMNHPGIARVFDAGATPQGRPYFAMEYVKGESITTYCDRQKLNTRQRLDLFLQTCAGVQHAHQKGVIHRDIKPSNVLVAIQDGRAVPKIIDFGVAKATAQRLTEQTLYTGLGVLIGTPEYMSPEQAEMTTMDVDTRTDVYALGVLLYELLSGRLPFESAELRRAGYDELRRKIREEEAPRPSTRLSTLDGEQTRRVAERRHADPASLRRQVAGDLDWIVMKALEKDRTRRYGSPNELAADILRHLRHEPVEAGPPSLTYRSKKFVRRNRVAVTFASVVFVLLAGFAAALAVQAGRLAVQRDLAETEALRAGAEAERANREADTSNRVADFMTRLFEIPDPGEARGNSVTAREILDRGAVWLEEEFAGEPRIKAQLLHAMGRTYLNLGMTQLARDLMEQAVDTGAVQIDNDGPRLAAMLAELAFVQFTLRDLAGARDSGERSLAIWKQVQSPDRPDLARTLTGLGWTAFFRGRPEAAADYARQAEVIWAQHREVDDWRAGRNLELLMSLASSDGRYSEAVERANELIDMYDRVERAGSYWNPLANPLDSAANMYLKSGQFERATELHQRMLDIQAALYGPDSIQVGTSLSSLSVLYKEAGQYRKARELVEQAVAVLDEHPDSPALGQSLWSLATTLQLQGDIESALQAALLAHALEEGLYGPEHPEVSGNHAELALYHLLTGNQARGQFHYRRLIDLWKSPHAIWSVIACRNIQQLAQLALEANNREDAARLYAIAVAEWGFSHHLHPGRVAVLEEYAALLRDLGRDAEAAEHETKAAEVREKLAAESNTSTEGRTQGTGASARD